MAASMDVILLERVESLGVMGEVVRVKPGYARNFLLPQKKALRATEDNRKYFDSQRAALEKLNAERKTAAEKHAKKFKDLKITLIRHAAEGGQLYGSVSARDISEAINDQHKLEVGRNQIELHQGFKTVGLFPVTLALHPEVKVELIANVARSEEEAKQQAKTGQAVVREDFIAGDQPKVDEDAMRALLDDSAFEAEQRERVVTAQEEAEMATSRAEKSTKRSAKKKTKAEHEDDEEGDED